MGERVAEALAAQGMGLVHGGHQVRDAARVLLGPAEAVALGEAADGAGGGSAFARRAGAPAGLAVVGTHWNGWESWQQSTTKLLYRLDPMVLIGRD